MTLDELSTTVCKLLFECGEFESVDFSTVIEHINIDSPQTEKSDIEKIMELIPSKSEIEVIQNVKTNQLFGAWAYDYKSHWPWTAH